MKALSRIHRRLTVLFSRNRFDRDLEEEMRNHIEMQAEENQELGMPTGEAYAAARRRLGNVTLWKEISREVWGWAALERLGQDLLYAQRLLRRNPGFSTAAILTLALAIGLNTAIFSVLNTVVLRPLPFQQPDRLVLIQEHFPKMDTKPFGVSAPDCVKFQTQNRVFEDTAAFKDGEADLSGTGEAERIRRGRVSAGLFRLLGVQPLIGRTFTDDEDRHSTQVALLSYGLWQRSFGSDPSIAGRIVYLDRNPYTVLGVMPSGFEFPLYGLSSRGPVDLWVPISFTPAELKDIGNNYSYGLLARLKTEVTLEQAKADSEAIARRIWQDDLSDLPGAELHAVLTPVPEAVTGKVATLLWLLLGAVGFVLLIACANVSSLLLARATTRQKEIAIRVALGAGRVRLFRQFLTESVLLAATGASLGLLLAAWALRLFVRFSPGYLPRLHEIAIDWRILLFTIAITSVTAVIFGLLPALAMSGRQLNDPLKESARGATTGRGRLRLRNALVAAELALAFILLAGAGLLIRSFAVLRATDPGFQAEHVLGLSLRLPEAVYSAAPQVRSFYQELLDRIAVLPGVRIAAAGTSLPMAGNTDRIFTPEGYERGPADQWPRTNTTWVMGNYFQALGIPLLRGRAFSPADTKSSTPVVMIDQDIAARFWPGQDPVGKRLKWGAGGNSGEWITVAGVVGNVRNAPFDEESLLSTYLPYSQAPDSRVLGNGRAMRIIVRTNVNPESVAASLRAAVWSFDSQIAVADLRTMKEVIGRSMAVRRFNMILLGIFAGLALVLAIVGVYGVIAYSVAQRTHEIGVRIALGARRADVLRAILKQGGRLAAIGVCLGLAGASIVTRLMSSLLFGVEPNDSVTLMAASLILFAVAMLATFLPARRAARVNPVEALRSE